MEIWESPPIAPSTADREAVRVRETFKDCLVSKQFSNKRAGATFCHAKIINELNHERPSTT
jgi:hypothetical protein